MAIYHLWLDFETTGLNPQADTVLEAAWTITDEDLWMLTPLRTRLCVITPPHGARHPEGFDVGDRLIGDEGDWKHLGQVVFDMHEMSGLRKALEAASNDPVKSLRVLTQARDLERLICEDLADVGYDRYQDKLALSGAGVSHFDDRVLDQHLPKMFPLAGQGPTGYTYWRHDVSVARRVIGEHTWEDLKSQVNTPKRSLEIYGCQVVLPEREMYAPVRVNRLSPAFAEGSGEAPFVFMPDEFTGHRAADDVAQALIDGRILRGVNR